jgi:hypothetical protein
MSLRMGLMGSKSTSKSVYIKKVSMHYSHSWGICDIINRFPKIPVERDQFPVDPSASGALCRINAQRFFGVLFQSSLHLLIEWSDEFILVKNDLFQQKRYIRILLMEVVFRD